MTSDSEKDLNIRNDFILNYKKLVSSLENQQSSVNISIINYHKFLIEHENFFSSGEEMNHIRSELNNAEWKISEVNQFFTALQRCGKHNPVEISRRIKTKTPLQVMMYIEQLENELQYAKEIGRIKKEPLNYKYIPAAREMSKKWANFENKSAKILIQKLEENEINRRINVNPATNELKLQEDKTKIELLKLDMKAKDKKPSDHVLCSLYDVLKDWLTIIIHDLIILNQHHERLYPHESIEHLITVQDICRVLRFRGYKTKSLANINAEDQSSNIDVSAFLQRNNSTSFLRNLDGNNQHDNWSTDTDDDYNIEVEEEEILGDNENSEGGEDIDVEEYAEYEQFEQDHKLESKESIIDRLYEKALVKLLLDNSTDRFSKLREDKLESIFYHATVWNDYISHIKLDKALDDDDDDQDTN